MRKYNKVFIEEFEEDKYIDSLNKINHLDVIRNNYNHRNDFSFKIFDGSLYLFKESLDHYVLKRIEEDSNFINSQECDNYFLYLKKLLNQDKLELLTNIVLYNIINNEKYNDYKVKYKLDTYLIKSNSCLKEINNIMTRINNNKGISQKELDLVCNFVSDYRDNTPELERIIIYIFNNLTFNGCNLVCTPQVSRAILTYIPYTCNEINLNNFSSNNIRLVLANIYKNKEYQGIKKNTYQDMNIIFKGSVIKNTKFKNITANKNPFSFDDYLEHGGFSYPLLLLIIFCEIDNLYKLHISKYPYDLNKLEFLKEGYPYIIDKIFLREIKEYQDSFSYNEYYNNTRAWKMCNSFFNKIIKESKYKEMLLRRSKRNNQDNFIKYHNNELIDTFYQDSNTILKIMKDSARKEKYLKKYPNLLCIFFNNGTFKIDTLLIDNFGDTKVGCELINTLLTNKNFSKIIEKLISNNSQHLDIISSNIYKGIIIHEKRLAEVEKIIKKEKNIDISEYLKIINSIMIDFDTIIKNGKNILNQILLCYKYDGLLEKYQVKMIEKYDEIINLISVNNKKRG